MFLRYHIFEFFVSICVEKIQIFDPHPEKLSHASVRADFRGDIETAGGCGYDPPRCTPTDRPQRQHRRAGEVQYTVHCMPRLWHGEALLWEPLFVLKKKGDDEWASGAAHPNALPPMTLPPFPPGGVTHPPKVQPKSVKNPDLWPKSDPWRTPGVGGGEVQRLQPTHSLLKTTHPPTGGWGHTGVK